jgi:hypothetical protein
LADTCGGNRSSSVPLILPFFFSRLLLSPLILLDTLPPDLTTISWLRLNRLAFFRQFWLPDGFLILRVMHVQLPSPGMDECCIEFFVPIHSATNSSLRSSGLLAAFQPCIPAVINRDPPFRQLWQPRYVDGDPSR